MIHSGGDIYISQEKILLQTDGPFNNILKFKSPMVFSEENAKHLLATLDKVFTETEAATS